MSHRTYSSRVIVIRKTKLGESDLILTMLAEDGQQLRAVAKGARKPTSPFASRLELFSCADVLFATGRNLDVVSEVRLVEGNEPIRSDFDLYSLASPMVELLCHITDKGLESSRLFPMTQKALAALASAEDHASSLICSAFLLKALSFAGFKPSFDTCVLCGDSVTLNDKVHVSISYEEGGVVCPACSSSAECIKEDARSIEWARLLLYSRFEDIAVFSCDSRTESHLLQFCQQWARYHVGRNLRSLTFLLANGSFS